MHIEQIQVENFRNLDNQIIPFSNQINLITGHNGAGKTALLEAIYLLGRQKSFRHPRVRTLIKHNHDYLRLIAKTHNPAHHIGLERKLNGKNLNFELRIDRQSHNNPEKLVQLIPVIAITAHSFQLIDAAPVNRKSFMDYSAFHCDHRFFRHAKHYKKALQNRNMAIKQKQKPEVIKSFDPILSQQGEAIHVVRKETMMQFNQILSAHLERLNFPLTISINYFSGWQSEQSLADCLNKNFELDYRLSHTRMGPHRADLKILANQKPAITMLSRGQQKLLILAMHLAQIDLISQHAKQPPLLIFDDIAAELDGQKRNLVIDYLAKLNCQMFFSATEHSLFLPKIRSLASLIQLKSGKVV